MTFRRTWGLALVAALAGVVLLPACNRRKAAEVNPIVPSIKVNRAKAPLGNALEISYSWTVEPGAKKLDQNYWALVHFLDNQEVMLFSDDHQPEPPPSTCEPGKTYSYTRTRFVPIYPYVGEVEVRMGLYPYPGRGERPALKGEDRGFREYKVATLELLPQTENVFLVYKEGWHNPETHPENQAHAVVGDVTATDFGARFVGTALERFGSLDIIVNNAGYAWDSVVQKMTDEQWQAMLDVHATASARILRAAAEPIRQMAKKEKDEGRVVQRKVVNITSIAGMYGNPGQAAYCAAKAAGIGLTKALAKEWGRYHVNVNAVAFGYIQTRMTQPLGSADAVAHIGSGEIRMGVQPEMLEFMQRMIPLGRGGTPEEAAGAVFLFCIPESDYISGEVVLVSGGFVM